MILVSSVRQASNPCVIPSRLPRAEWHKHLNPFRSLSDPQGICEMLEGGKGKGVRWDGIDDGSVWVVGA